MEKINFNKPYMTGKELWYISKAHHNNQLSGDGPFTKMVHKLLEGLTGTKKALLTHSCTAALEMAAILIDLEPGDEVIVPAYTFVSTANAFALRGAKIVFADVRSDNLNIDESKLESLINEKTKAIVPVHYAGVACDMDEIMRLAKRYELVVIEDAAQAIGADYKGRPLGTIGHLGTYSFHETKNITSGEGGALLINDSSYCSRAEIIREKGTNRSKFFRGEVDKYTWIDIGSSFLPGEVVAAFLLAQLEELDRITQRRLRHWNYYHQRLGYLEKEGKLRRPIVDKDSNHNAHMYYIILESLEERARLIQHLAANNIKAVFHYIPLHESPAGKKYGEVRFPLSNTSDFSHRLLRLPLFVEMKEEQLDYICQTIESFWE